MQKQSKNGNGNGNGISPSVVVSRDSSAHRPSRSSSRDRDPSSARSQGDGTPPSPSSSQRVGGGSWGRDHSPSPHMRDTRAAMQGSRNIQNSNPNHFHPESSSAAYISPSLNRNSKSRKSTPLDTRRKQDEKGNYRVSGKVSENGRDGTARQWKVVEAEQGRGRGRSRGNESEVRRDGEDVRRERLVCSTTLPLPQSVSVDEGGALNSAHISLSQTYPHSCPRSSKPMVRPKAVSSSARDGDTDRDENAESKNNGAHDGGNVHDMSINSTKRRSGHPRKRPQGSPLRAPIDNISSAFQSIQDKEEEEQNDNYRSKSSSNDSYIDDDDENSWVAEAKDYFNLLQSSEKTDRLKEMRKIQDPRLEAQKKESVRRVPGQARRKKAEGQRGKKNEGSKDDLLSPIDMLSASSTSSYSGSESGSSDLSNADQESSFPPTLPLPGHYSSNPSRDARDEDGAGEGERYSYSNSFIQSEVDDKQRFDERRVKDIDSEITGGYTEIAATARRRSGASQSLLEPTEGQVLRQRAMGITPNCHKYFTQKHRSHCRDYDSDGTLSLTSVGRSWRGGSFEGEVTPDSYQEMQMEERYSKWNPRYKVPVDVYGFSRPFSRRSEPGPGPTAYPPLYDESVHRMRRGFEQSPQRGTFNRAPKYVTDIIDARTSRSGSVGRRFDGNGRQYIGYAEERDIRDCLSREREVEDNLLIEIEAAMALEIGDDGMALDSHHFNGGPNSYRAIWGSKGRRPVYGPHIIR